jgi:hypothetical protein
MQYHSSKIHLHRPTAGFGSSITQQAAQSEASRKICVENATSITNGLQDYRELYADASTLSGVSVHIIAAASTILIADIAEKRSTDISCQRLALKTCVRTLSELEQTYIVARRVRRVIQLVMRLCHLDIEHVEFQQELNASSNESKNLINPESDSFASGNVFQLDNYGLELMEMSGFSPVCIDEFLPVSSQFDIMYSLQSF